jgi:hypothetical protein
MGYGAGGIPSLLYSEEFVVEECFLPAGITLQPTFKCHLVKPRMCLLHTPSRMLSHPHKSLANLRPKILPFKAKVTEKGGRGVLVDADDDPRTPMLPATGSASAASPTNVE